MKDFAVFDGSSCYTTLTSRILSCCVIRIAAVRKASCV